MLTITILTAANYIVNPILIICVFCQQAGKVRKRAMSAMFTQSRYLLILCKIRNLEFVVGSSSCGRKFTYSHLLIAAQAISSLMILATFFKGRDSNFFCCLLLNSRFLFISLKKKPHIPQVCWNSVNTYTFCNFQQCK